MSLANLMDTNISKYIDLQKYKDGFDYWASFLWSRTRCYAQPYISTYFDVHKVVDGLYIGDFPSACNYDELKSLKVTHILNVVAGVLPMFPNDFTYKNIDICDTPTVPISNYFEECVKFITDAIKGGGCVYVHCMCGISRSATMIAAYLISQGYTDEQATKLIKEKRPCTNPNKGFRRQLKKYYESHVSQKEKENESSDKKQ